MTKTQIKAILKTAVKDGWVLFEEDTDKDYYLKCLKNDDLEDVITSLENAYITQGREIVEDMRDELDNLD